VRQPSSFQFLKAADCMKIDVKILVEVKENCREKDLVIMRRYKEL